MPQPAAEFTLNDAERLDRLLKERIRRESEGLRIFRPLPDCEKFHAGREKVRVLLGGNRSSKTTSWAVEIARAVTGQDPHGKFPKRDGVAFIFGPNELHIGNVIYVKLFKAGLVDMIRDENTGRWRAFHPLEDAARAHLKKPAPPLIPPRMIKEIAWAKKKLHIPKLVRLRNGWELHFFSTLGELPRGQAIDLGGIDEEVDNEGVIAELRARCVDRNGKIIWGATPQQATDQLFDLCEDDGNGLVKVYKTHIKNNPYISEADKLELFKGLSEEDRKVRWDGEFLLSGFQIYPEFSEFIHGWNRSHFQVPHDWCTYLVVDPGRQRAGSLFLAMPPPNLGLRIALVYDEIYRERCDANMWGKLAAEKSAGRAHEQIIMDAHLGKAHDVGSGRNIQVQYQEAYRRHGGRMREPTQAFTWGCDDVQAGLTAVRDWLRIGSNGKPYLYVMTEKCPNLLNEFQKYRFAPMPGDKRVPSDIPRKKYDHLMDCLRYLAMGGLVYKAPKRREQDHESPVYLSWLAKQRQGLLKRSMPGMDLPGISFGIGNRAS